MSALWLYGPDREESATLLYNVHGMYVLYVLLTVSLLLLLLMLLWCIFMVAIVAGGDTIVICVSGTDTVAARG